MSVTLLHPAPAPIEADLVEILEMMLEKAKAGEITTIACLTMGPAVGGKEAHIGHLWAGDVSSPFEVLGGLAYLQSELVRCIAMENRDGNG